MEIEIIERTLRKAISCHRNLLPISSRDLGFDDLNTKNTPTFSQSNGSFNTFCDNWEEFLNNLDKFWNFLNAFKKHHVEDQKRKSLIDYLSKVSDQRTSDSLLIYLDKARNNSQHTLWRHLKESKPYEVITGHGASITISDNEIQVTGSGDSAKEVTILMKPGLILLNYVKVVEPKKGEIIYDLPISHLGDNLKPMERVLPQIVGLKGIQYYSNVLIEFKAII